MQEVTAKSQVSVAPYSPGVIKDVGWAVKTRMRAEGVMIGASLKEASSLLSRVSLAAEAAS